MGDYMNDLNSVLFEGKVINDVELIDNTTCQFMIASNRYVKKDDVETTQIFVESSNPNIYTKIYKNRKVRIVGRLKQVADKIVIVTEHIELK